MWMLNFLPDFLFHLITLAGVLGIVASFFFGFIPFVSQYKLPIQVASIIALVFGIYFEGGIANNAAWEARVKEMEVKVAESEVKAAKENIKIVEKVVLKEKIIRERAVEIDKTIDNQIAAYDSQCNIPDVLVETLNKAAEQPK